MIKEAGKNSDFGPSPDGRRVHWARAATAAVLVLIIACAVLTASGCSSVGSISLFPVQSGDKWGYIDQTGRIIIKPQFSRVGLFADGLTPVWVGEDVGYVDTRGAIKIKPQFDSAGSFSEGLAPVLVNMRVGFINESGTQVVKPTYSDAAPFDENVAPVKQGTKWGFIDKSGKVVIPFNFDDVGSFTDGLARAKTGDKWGYIDHSGNYVIQPQYVASGTASPPVLHFQQDRAPVFSDGNWKYIDKTGKQAFQRTFFLAGEFSEGLAPVVVNTATDAGATTYRLGFIDTSGNMVIKPQFDGQVTLTDALGVGFHKGVSPVRQVQAPGLWGYINADGKFVVQPKFGYADNFLLGPVTMAELNGFLVYIDQTGKVLYTGPEVVTVTTTPTTVTAPGSPESPTDTDVSAETSSSTTTTTAPATTTGS